MNTNDVVGVLLSILLIVFLIGLIWATIDALRSYVRKL